MSYWLAYNKLHTVIFHKKMVDFERNVNEGGDIHEENELGQTALHVAVINDDLEMVKFLLSRGADVNRKTRILNDDCNSLIKCECENKKYCFHIADEYGNEMIDEGQNALHLAVKHASKEVVRLLLDCIKNIDDVSEDRSTALHYVSQNSISDQSDVHIAKLLLKAGSNINVKNALGKSPLYLAVKLEKLNLVDYLLSQGADVNASTKNLSTPLYSALINCNVDQIKLLFDRKISTDVKNKYNENPLFYILRVIEKGNMRLHLVQLLLDSGFNADCRNSHASSPLHIAIQTRDRDLAKFLIQRGCSIDSKDNFDMSPLSIAVCTNLKEEAWLLLRLGANVNGFIKNSSILEHAIIRRKKSMVQLLLDHGADVNIGSERNRPVVVACLHKNTQIMQMLIDKGADINYRSKNGRTPLMRAIAESNYIMMKYLLRHGANVNGRDHNGNTPLHVLFESSSHSEDLIEYLLEQGADVNAENNGGCTPFAYMMFKCFTKVEVLTFVKHVALRIARGLHINLKITQLIQRERPWIDLVKRLESYLQELERMKETKIQKQWSYFDILIKKHSALTGLFDDVVAANTFIMGVRRNLFPQYADLLERNFNRKSERFRLLRESIELLDNAFQNRIPLELVEILCEYFSNSEMKIITAESDGCTSVTFNRFK